MELTAIDRMILESYKKMLDGLADYLGVGYEFVLHSLEDLERSVVKIINGEHTGRKEGAPITNLALNVLFQLQEGNLYNHLSYFATNKQGEALKSSTILIRGEKDRVIGLLCINFYLNTPFSTILEAFQSHVQPISAPVKERYTADTEELLLQATQSAKEQVDLDAGVSPSLKNREIVRLLYHQGIFNMKNAVQNVADVLNISRNTVYMHLRTIRSENTTKRFD